MVNSSQSWKSYVCRHVESNLWGPMSQVCKVIVYSICLQCFSRWRFTNFIFLLTNKVIPSLFQRYLKNDICKTIKKCLLTLDQRFTTFRLFYPVSYRYMPTPIPTPIQALSQKRLLITWGARRWIFEASATNKAQKYCCVSGHPLPPFPAQHPHQKKLSMGRSEIILFLFLKK